MTQPPFSPDEQRPPQAPPPQGPPPARMGPPPPPGYGPPAGWAPPVQPPQAAPPVYQAPPQGPPPAGPWGVQPPPPWYGAPQAGGPGGRPPYQAPDPRRVKRSAWPLVIGLVIFFFVMVIVMVPLLGGLLAGGGGRGSGASLLPFGDKIAVLEVDGVLGEGPAYGADTKRLRETVERWTDDTSIKGMVVRVNSPGGAVSATQDLYQAIENFAGTKRPVYVSMGDVAASGGYYVSMAADKVFANSGTLTGSVGVIMSFWGYQELTDKIGLEPRTIKSGEFKDIGSGSRPMTEEEKALLNEMISDVYEQFYGVVLNARSMAVRKMLAESTSRKPTEISAEDVNEHLRSYCDGRVVSGHQALEYGMVDELGTFNDAVEAMKKRLGVTGEVHLVHTPKPQPGLFGMMESAAAKVQTATPGTAKLEFRFTM